MPHVRLVSPRNGHSRGGGNGDSRGEGASNEIGEICRMKDRSYQVRARVGCGIDDNARALISQLSSSPLGNRDLQPESEV